MLKRAEHNKRYATVFWVLSVVCMGVIFYLSSRTADQSSRESGAVLAWLTRLLGDGRLTDFLVRKSAHFLEYTGLCLLLSFACAATWGRRYTAVSLPLASLYAITDEVHQRFVPGRSCQAADWAIDTAGAALWTAVCRGAAVALAALSYQKGATRIDIAAKSYII